MCPLRWTEIDDTHEATEWRLWKAIIAGLRHSLGYMPLILMVTDTTLTDYG